MDVGETYLPVFSCDTGEFTLKRLFTDLSSVKKVNRIQPRDLSIKKNTRRDGTYLSKSLIHFSFSLSVP
jgi:hypothetical protein